MSQKNVVANKGYNKAVKGIIIYFLRDVMVRNINYNFCFFFKIKVPVQQIKWNYHKNIGVLVSGISCWHKMWYIRIMQ